MNDTPPPPRVSVLTPIYNTEPAHLREAIESILNQTFRDFEFIILNDSPDNAELERIVRSYDDPRIRYVVNERNIGISESRNRLLDLARGDYVAVFDHDDISMPTRLEKEVAVLDGDATVGIVGSNIRLISSGRTSRHPLDNITIKRRLTLGCCVTHTSVLIRKSLLTKHGIRYEGAYSPAEDYMLFLRLIPHARFANIAEPLVQYRDFSGNTSHRRKHQMDDASELCRNFALLNYPYLFGMLRLPQLMNKKCHYRLFGILPILTIKVKPTAVWYRLFGFIPILKLAR